jgi:hypothetical protein
MPGWRYTVDLTQRTVPASSIVIGVVYIAVLDCEVCLGMNVQIIIYFFGIISGALHHVKLYPCNAFVNQF